MNTQATPEVQPFIAVIDGEIKTTSLKVAEHFGKPHKDVLEKIKNAECSPEFTERNFSLSEYTDSTGRKLPCYELTRNGFFFAALGFTGKKAAKWREAYITAFSAMEKELQQRQLANQPASLLTPPAITEAQQGEIFALVAEKSRATGRFNAYFWTRFKDYFKLSSYKHLPAGRFDEACDFLRRLESDARDSFVMLSHKELNALVAANDLEAAKQSEESLQLTNNIITLTLAPTETMKRWLITQGKTEVVTLLTLSDDKDVMSRGQFIRQLSNEGFLVIKKNEILNRLEG